MDTTDPYSLAARAAEALAAASRVPRHDLLVVLGSGWSHAAALLPGGVDVPVERLPGFATPTIEGHGGALRSVRVGDAAVLVALGRIHLYEGHTPSAVVHTVRTAAAAGCRSVVLTNAAGSMRREWPVGAPVLIADQINATGVSPLTGPNPPPPAPDRFVDMSAVYPHELRALAHEVEPGLAEGVYVGMHGPEFETPAEIEAYRRAGADLVGMSTVLEAIAAAHLGMAVLGLALCTNLAAGLGDGRLDAEHVFAVARRHAPAVGDLLRRVIERLAAEASLSG